MNDLKAILAPYLKEAAIEVVELQLLTGTEACEDYGISRSSLNHITKTYEPGASRPKYMRRNIRIFLEGCEMRD